MNLEKTTIKMIEWRRPFNLIGSAQNGRDNSQIFQCGLHQAIEIGGYDDLDKPVSHKASYGLVGGSRQFQAFGPLFGARFEVGSK